MDFYKKGEYFFVSNTLTPRGYYLLVDLGGGNVQLSRLDNSAPIFRGSVSNLKREDGTGYENLDTFLGEVGDFFTPSPTLESSDGNRWMIQASPTRTTAEHTVIRKLMLPNAAAFRIGDSVLWSDFNTAPTRGIYFRVLKTATDIRLTISYSDGIVGSVSVFGPLLTFAEFDALYANTIIAYSGVFNAGVAMLYAGESVVGSSVSATVTTVAMGANSFSWINGYANNPNFAMPTGTRDYFTLSADRALSATDRYRLTN